MTPGKHNVSALKQNTGPIFIVGSPRSGTTLLQYMLRAHPRISLPTGESHFIVPLYRNREAYGEMSNLQSLRKLLIELQSRYGHFLSGDLHGIKFDSESLAREFHQAGASSIADVITFLFEKNAKGEGKVRWGDKTPYYALHLPTMLEMFPSAQFIHLIRDGRGVALSLMDRKHDFKVYNAYHAAKYWQQYVETARISGQALGQGVYLETHYEELLNDPERELRKICAFLGEDYFPSLLDYQKPEETTHTLLHKPIQKENGEKWRHKLSSSEISLFESGAGETLRAFGYVPLTGAEPHHRAVRGLFRLHNSLMGWWNKNEKSWKGGGD